MYRALRSTTVQRGRSRRRTAAARPTSSGVGIYCQSTCSARQQATPRWFVRFYLAPSDAVVSFHPHGVRCPSLQLPFRRNHARVKAALLELSDRYDRISAAQRPRRCRSRPRNRRRAIPRANDHRGHVPSCGGEGDVPRESFGGRARGVREDRVHRRSACDGHLLWHRMRGIIGIEFITRTQRKSLRGSGAAVRWHYKELECDGSVAKYNVKNSILGPESTSILDQPGFTSPRLLRRQGCRPGRRPYLPRSRCVQFSRTSGLPNQPRSSRPGRRPLQSR